MADLLRQLDEEADAEYELESEEGSLFTGSVLFIGLVMMAWAGVIFAYFYLRQIDRAGLWRPHDLRPPYLLGTMIGVSVVAGAILYSWGVSRLRHGMAFEFQIGAWLCAACGFIATGLQVWQLTRLGFLPGESGYTSVFVGFAILNVAFLLFGAFWAETLAARGLRLGAHFDPETYLGVSVMPEIRIWRGSLKGCLYFWWFMVVVSIFFWVLFYIL